MPGSERGPLTDYHVITPEAGELVMRLAGGKMVIVSPTPLVCPGVSAQPSRAK